MLNEQQIKQLFAELNAELRQLDEIGEVGIVGGAVMCLIYKSRAATRDVDAIFEPASLLRKLVAKIAIHHDLPEDWLNDAAKGFIRGPFDRQPVLELSHLRIWAPEGKYMLAMKCISARWDTSDRDDVIFLIGHLGLATAPEVFAIIEHFYPKNQIPPKTQFFIEEVFELQAPH
jgi:Nucleotidyltransferase of unknown function (DUF6036)